MKRAEAALHEKAVSRLDPQYAEREEALEIKLRNQGLVPGDEAYDREMRKFAHERTDAYNQVLYSALEVGQQAHTNKRYFWLLFAWATGDLLLGTLELLP